MEKGTVNSLEGITKKGTRMNAYEMADLMILFDSGRIWEHAEEIANMLRQQADRIKELELKYKQEFEYAENLLKDKQ
jgi:type II secretory pathway component GspD/PulD (secretin)